MKRRLLLLLVALAACQPKPPERPRSEGQGDLVMMQTGSLNNLDPLQILYRFDWQKASMVFEGLIGFKAGSADIEPLLAQSWQVEDGGRRYVFTLRDSVWFHDDACFPGGKGRRFSADDVKNTFQCIARHMDECPNGYLLQNTLLGLEAFARGDTEAIAGLKVIDSLHVEMTLSQARASFLHVLATPLTYIVPREAVAYYGDHFGTHPVGTGPFTLAAWTPFESVEFIRHDRYWKVRQGRRLPRLNSVTFYFRDTMEETFTEFVKGSNHLFVDSGPSASQLIASLNRPDEYPTITAPVGLTTRFFAFSMNHPSVTSENRGLRRELALRFQKECAAKGPKEQRMRIARTLVPPELLQNRLPLTAAKTEKARCFPEDTLTIMSNLATWEMDVLQEQIHLMGMETRQRIQRTRYFETIQKEAPNLFRVSFLPSFPDPLEYYALFYSKSSPDVNVTGFSHTDFDALYEKAIGETDADKRLKWYLEMETVLKREAPAIYITHSTPAVFYHQPQLSGLQFRFILLDFSEVSLD